MVARRGVFVAPLAPLDPCATYTWLGIYTPVSMFISCTPRPAYPPGARFLDYCMDGRSVDKNLSIADSLWPLLGWGRMGFGARIAYYGNTRVLYRARRRMCKRTTRMQATTRTQATWSCSTRTVVAATAHAAITRDG